MAAELDDGMSSVVAGAGACLMSSSPGRPAQPVAEVLDRAGCDRIVTSCGVSFREHASAGPHDPDL